FMYWSSFELQFLEIPDHVAGSSSAMPQKKNPFLLEHVQSRGATAVGAHVAACSAMLKSPFSNSISVGTEATKHIWSALSDVNDACVLLNEFVAEVKPRPERML